MRYLVKPLVGSSANSPLFFKGSSRPNVDRIYTIASVKSGLVLTQQSDGYITQQKWTESDRQRWKIIPLSDSERVNGNYYLKGIFKIECVANRKLLDVPGGKSENAVQLNAWDFNSAESQKWRLVELAQGAYRIENIKSGKVIDVRDGSLGEGSAIQQYQSNDTDAQKWLLSEVRNTPQGSLFDRQVTVYQDGDYGGASQKLGPGKYDVHDLSFGNDQISSLKVPEGLRVDLYEHANFRGNHKMFAADTRWVGDDFNDQTSAILVEEVATFYNQPNYQGKKLILGIGRYKLTDIGGSAGTPQYGTGDFDINWNDQIKSMKVPASLTLTLYEHGDFTGSPFVFNEDVPDLNQYKYPNDVSASVTSSIIIKAIGIVIPNNVLNFGDTISLRSHHGRWMSGNSNGNLRQEPQDQVWEKFTIWRAGDTKYDGIVSYGDIIGLKNNAHNKYVGVRSDGTATASSNALDSWEKFVIVRAGETQSNIFVCQGDKIGLRSLAHNRYLGGQDSGGNWVVTGSSGQLLAWETWTIDTDIKPRNTPSESGGGTSVCGLEACANDICGAAACGAAAGYATICGADACGAAACGVAGSLVSACGAAASGVAVCGADLVGVGVSGLSACGAAVAGLAVCGADACGAAACGAAACGAAACGAAACGGDACGAAASGIGGSLVNACAADAGGIDYCVANACAANACAIDLCPADACAADACAIDIIPIIPFI